ncbi:hypothetical protein I4U23_001521 [Adineta vaga]|nr:hypothetical protein I4U23_001521 [Adineta vaga]
MSMNITCLEDLPNELIVDICKYVDARQLFHSFSYLNNRFTKLLFSLNCLHLTISLFDMKENKNDEILLHCIRTLIIDRGINISLRKFKNLRCLILRNPKEKIFEQLNFQFIHLIEYLSITHKFNTTTIQSSINDLYQRIFSNDFPYLKSCHFIDIEVQHPNESWQQCFSLKFLRIGKLNPIIYRSILSACPNLHFIQFTTLLPLIESTLPNLMFHFQLRQMIIKDDDLSLPWNDQHIQEYLQCIPNLEKLTIYRSTSFRKITDYSNYDWFASILLRSLRLLQKFQLILNIYDKKRFTKCFRENMFCALKEQFHNVHKYHYQARIRILA